MLFLLLCGALLTGCWNARELEHMYYAHAIGVDYKEGKYYIYVQILNFNTLGKQQSGDQQAQGSWVGRGEGSSIQSAMHQLYSSTQQRIFWGHLSAGIVSESVMRKGLTETIDQLTRFNEFRYTTWVFGARGNIEELLKTSPILDKSPVYSQLGDPTDVYKQSSFIQPLRLNRLIIDINEPSRTVKIPLFVLKPGDWSDQKNQYSALSVEGIAVLRNGKWGGNVSFDNAIGLRWLDKKTVRTPLIVTEGASPMASLIISDPDIKITPILDRKSAFFKITIQISATIIEQTSDLGEKLLKEKIANKIEEEIRKTYKEGLRLKVDILELSDVLYRNHVKEWKRIKSNDGFFLTEESLQSIDITVKIRNIGKVLRPFKENQETPKT